jgi:hypothetical protein
LCKGDASAPPPRMVNLLGFLDAGYDTNEKSHGEWISIAAQEGTSETIGDVGPF